MILLLLVALALTNCEIFTNYKPFETELPIPKIIDMRHGGTLNMMIGKTNHYWGGGLDNPGQVYGYAAYGDSITYPGPTILVEKDVPLTINWFNSLTGKHILDNFVDPALVSGKSSCYFDNCGVNPFILFHLGTNHLSYTRFRNSRKIRWRSCKSCSGWRVY
jgi:hypothetical protein